MNVEATEEYVMKKIAYTAPALKKIGSFEELTRATSTGSFIDGTYPVHTPIAGHLS